MRFAKVLAAVSVFLLSWVAPAHSSSITITDNRLESLNGLPDLGRGYNIQQNTLEAVCFSQIEKPKPVFDFFYEIEEIDDSFINRLKASDSQWRAQRELVEMIKEHLVPGDQTLSSEGETTQNVVARIVMESYYNTLNEANSVISPNAAQLLKNGQYVSFFNSCGFFYVRSLRFVSDFVALFQYDSIGTEEDAEYFESLLKENLLQFNTDEARQRVLAKESERRKLRIFVRSHGLGKGQEMVNLLPMSLAEFRKSVQSAVQLMRVAETGVLDSMEVAPWHDHPQVLGMVAKGAKEDFENFRRAQNLEMNSQVISSIRFTLDHMMDEYYKARLCRMKIYEDYPVDTDLLAKLSGYSFDPTGTWFKNNATFTGEEKPITLVQFRKFFEEHPPAEFMNSAQAFLLGIDNGSGAESCIKELFNRGLADTDFRDIPACVTAIDNLSISNRFLDEYCQPVPLKKLELGR